MMTYENEYLNGDWLYSIPFDDLSCRPFLAAFLQFNSDHAVVAWAITLDSPPAA